jgi:HEAT repeat protein
VAGAAERQQLTVLAGNDPAPEVRRAALRRLSELDGARALEPILRAFSDRERAVRHEAAQLAAALGSEAVPRLREVALGWPAPAPETAVASLALSSAPEAQAALRELADAHSDPKVRGLAGLAIGRPLGEAH